LGNVFLVFRTRKLEHAANYAFSAVALRANGVENFRKQLDTSLSGEEADKPLKYLRRTG